VAKDEDLNLCGVVKAMLRRDNGEEPTKHHIEELSTTSDTSCQAARPPRPTERSHGGPPRS
jgi:hypothetical protein